MNKTSKTNREASSADPLSAELHRLAKDQQTLSLLAHGSGKAEMTISLRLSVNDWITLLTGAARNNVSAGTAIACLISNVEDIDSWEMDGFSMPPEYTDTASN